MKKSSKTFLFSAGGVAAVFLILVSLNVIAGFFKARADLTAERAFTLTAGTRAVLKKIDAPIQVRLYVTRGPEMPVELRNYAAQVEDMLEEYRQLNPEIRIEKLDPEPDSDAEDSANLDGIEPRLLPNGEQVYLGVSVSRLDRKSAVSFLSPERERLLEYDLTRAIAEVLTDKKPVVGVLSPLPVMGMSPSLMFMGGNMQPPWAFVSELQRQFEVREIPFVSESIPEDVNVLLVIHPEGISDGTQYAIDQFVLRGGKLVAFLDPYCVLGGSSPMGGPGSSTLDKLLPAWGVEFSTAVAVADLDYMTQTTRGRQPGVLQLSEQAFDRSDVITGDIDNMLLVFAGAFQGSPAEGLQRTVLAKSSKHSQLVPPAQADSSPQTILDSFEDSGIEYPLAIRLTGKFKTAFPNGKPGAASSDNGEKDEADKDEAKTEENKEQAADSLKESTADGVVILVADADCIQDRAAIAELPNPFGQPVLVPSNGNLYFGWNAVEQLAGDENLISVRGRASRERPFTVVREMQAEARQKYQSTIQRLEDELQQTEAKLNQLQQAKSDQQQLILSPEQQQELENFRKKQAEVRQQLKEVRRDLARGIDSLETRLKWINIGLMPLVVAIAGLTFFFIKRQRAVRR